MTNRKNPNKLRAKCPECGSSLKCEDGHIFCTQDLFDTEYSELFSEWDKLPQDKLEKTLDSVSYKVYDMYNRWNHIDSESGERTQFCCTYDPQETFNPMTKSETILPDPAQTQIAEAILKRQLTVEEYYGQHRVPLLDDNGERYYGQIHQLVFPRDYSPEGKDMVIKTDFEPIPVVFKWEDL